MKPIHGLCLAGLTAALLAGPALADQKFPAELAGHSIIDAATFVAPPADAPELIRLSGKFTFPFVTIENVDVVDAEHIVVGNDNNLPYSSGRELGKQDHNELILLRVPQFLSAK